MYVLFNYLHFEHLMYAPHYTYEKDKLHVNVKVISGNRSKRLTTVALVQLTTWSYQLRLIDVKWTLSNHFPSTPTIRSNNNCAVNSVSCTVYYYT